MQTSDKCRKGLRSALAFLLALHCTLATAQSEGGLIVGAEAEKKINKQLSIGLEAEMRTRNNFKTMDRWKFGVGASYKLTKWLKASAGYDLLDYNNREKISYKASGAYNHWRPSYYGVKHRFNIALTGAYKFQNNIKVSLRERWQYSYRPETSTDRWDFDEAQWEDDYTRSGKGKNQLRSRIEVSYDKKRAKIEPYASAEFYHSWAIEKVRYTVGADYKLNKQHSIGAFYRFQNMKNVDDEDYDPDMHYLGIGYKFKF